MSPSWKPRTALWIAEARTRTRTIPSTGSLRIRTRALLGRIPPSRPRAGGDPGYAVVGGSDVSAGAEIRPDTVVVGVDGSAASRAALRWALTHGRAARVPVVGVTAWHSPVQTSPRRAAGRSETAERALADARAAVRAAQAGADVPVLTGHGRLAAVLTEHSAGAAMLVLGNSRPGALTAAASTVVECLRTAAVPVVVVPGAGE